MALLQRGIPVGPDGDSADAIDGREVARHIAARLALLAVVGLLVLLSWALTSSPIAPDRSSEALPSSPPSVSVNEATLRNGAR